MCVNGRLLYRIAYCSNYVRRDVVAGLPRHRNAFEIITIAPRHFGHLGVRQHIVYVAKLYAQGPPPERSLNKLRELGECSVHHVGSYCWLCTLRKVWRTASFELQRRGLQVDDEQRSVCLMSRNLWLHVAHPTYLLCVFVANLCAKVRHRFENTQLLQCFAVNELRYAEVLNGMHQEWESSKNLLP